MTRSIIRHAVRWGTAALVAVLCGACGSDSTTSPTTPSTTTATTTQIFASNITPTGTAVRYFTALQAGTVTVTLDNLSQSVPMGLGIGLGREETKQCYLSAAVTTVPGDSSQVSAPVDSGYYCAKLWDLGNLTDAASFSMTLKLP